MKKIVMEFIGTYFLVFAVAFTGNPLAIGLMLAVMVYVGGHISGGHYNPAVSFAFLIKKGLSIGQTLCYWAGQIAGATAAAFTYHIVKADLFLPAPAAGTTFTNTLIMELICTFALALVVLTVATSKKLEGNKIYGFAIGLTVTAIAFAGGPISGGAFNPAVGLGPMIISSSYTNLPLYILGPLSGGAIAAIIFMYLED